MLRNFLLMLFAVVLVTLASAASTTTTQRRLWLLGNHQRLNQLFAIGSDSPNLDIRTNVLLNMEGI